MQHQQPTVPPSTMTAQRGVPPAWQSAAVVAYAQETNACLRDELVARVHELTGCDVRENAVIVDRDARCATLALDGVAFQLRCHALVLLRPCEQCGVGLLASPELCSRADLGYALSAWHPCHTECESSDSPVEVDL